MKKICILLALIFSCVFCITSLTGCALTEVFDAALENDLLLEENNQLKSDLDFYNKFSSVTSRIGGDEIIELSDNINLHVGDKAGDALIVEDNAQVTINGGTYDGGQTPFGGAGNTAIWVKSATAKVIINDGYFHIKGLAIDGEGNKDTGHIDLIYCTSGTIEINGGLFEGENSDVWLLNCKDNYYKDGTAKIIVKGGTFINFDPSNCLSEGENTNFVAEGFVVVSETFNKDTAEEYTTYTVVEANI